MCKTILCKKNQYEKFKKSLLELNVTGVFLVCGKSARHLAIYDFIKRYTEERKITLEQFSDYTSNPTYESVKKGVDLFSNSQCNIIIAVGGGSAIDIAKCIKLFQGMNPKINYLNQEIVKNNITLVAVPTTAGTGSEATHFAVIYYNGEKQSVADFSCIPHLTVLDPSVLDTLPNYQKKATMIDALSHAIESYWSVNSTKESRRKSDKALRLILENREAYLKNDLSGKENMMKAANIAGQAINVTKTTAAHAMSYKLTSLYGIPHGHAVGLCLSKVWKYMTNHMESCVDKRGKAFVKDIFQRIAFCFHMDSVDEAIAKFEQDILGHEMGTIKSGTKEEEDILVNSVNLERLKNNPIQLSEIDLREIYRSIL